MKSNQKNNENTIETLTNIKVLGLRTVLSDSMSKNMSIIALHWKKFNVGLHKIKGYKQSKDEWLKYGITYREDYKLYYMCAIPLTDKMVCPDSMEEKNIYNGSYLKCIHFGVMRNLTQTVEKLFKEYIPAHSIILRKDEFFDIVMIERYDNRFHWSRTDSEIDILVPLVL